MALILNLFLMMTMIYYAFQQRCGVHLLPKIPIIPIDPTPKGKVRHLGSNTQANGMRIFIDYTMLEKAGLPADYLDKMKSNINKTAEYISKVFKVKNPSPILSITNYSLARCNITHYNENILSGIPYDLIIIPLINPDLKEGTAEAAATPFASNGTGEIKNDGTPDGDARPVAGFVYLVDNYDFNKINSDEYFQILLFHELSHVLGFNSQYFKNNQKTKTINGVNRTILTFPTLVSKAREYFGCPDLEGVEVENQGGSGTIGSHWEARVMYGDYMIGAEIGEHAISELTLALFEDLGWYEVNYYTGGLFRHGKNEGCEFLNSKCITYDENGKPTTKFPNEFCSKQNSIRCFPSRTSRGFCYQVNYGGEIKDKEYSYFLQNSQHGGYMYADFCPLPFSDKDRAIFYHDSCFSGIKKRPTDTLGHNSFCFLTTFIEENENMVGSMEEGGIYASCNQVVCNPAKKTYTVLFGNTTVNCPKNGGPAFAPGYYGEFYCPNYNLICTTNNICNNMLDCINRKATPRDSAFDYSSFDSSTFKEPEQDPSGSYWNGCNSKMYCKKYGIISLILALLFL